MTGSTTFSHMSADDWRELASTRDLDTDEALAYLLLDGGRVPCSRYGWDTASCAPVAIAVAEILAENDAGRMDTDTLDYVMGLVVNDHEDVESLIRDYGTDDQKALLD